MSGLTLVEISGLFSWKFWRYLFWYWLSKTASERAFQLLLQISLFCSCARQTLPIKVKIVICWQLLEKVFYFCIQYWNKSCRVPHRRAGLRECVISWSIVMQGLCMRLGRVGRARTAPCSSRSLLPGVSPISAKVCVIPAQQISIFTVSLAKNDS